MKTLTLRVEERKNSGKNYVKKLRSEGYTPAVVYGSRYKAKDIQAKTRELNRILMHQGFQGMVNLEIGNQVVPTIIKDVQNDMMRGNIIHIDFQHLSQDEKIKLSVPIILKGRESVEDKDRIVQQQLANLDIQCYPKYIPQEIVADADILARGEALTVGDLEILNDENIEVLHAPEEVIATLTYAAKYDESAEEEKEVTEGEETEETVMEEKSSEDA